MTSRPAILLNMIVKNEAHVIEKTLSNLCDKIPFTMYVISDTGSTDDTKVKIKDFFDKKGITGEIYDDEWRDFGYNRTKALEHAYNKSDLLFVFDADDSLHGDFKLPDKVDYDSYHLHFGNGYGLNYWRVCLVNNRKKWEYIGVLHEYIHLIDGQGELKNVYLQGDYYVQHGVSGGRSMDPMKYHKDAAILEKAFNDLPEKHDLRNRYAFYCANSYKDAREFDKAIEWYIRTTNLNGWAQEKYRSCIMLHDMYRVKGEVEKALFWAVKSVKFDQTRAEGIFKLVQYYCCEEMNNIAYAYYELIRPWYENRYFNDSTLADKLFVDILDYDFFLPYYMIIVSDKIGKREIGVKMYDMIFTKGKVSGQWWIDNLTFNFQFFYKLVGKDKVFGEKAKSYLKILEANNLTPKESFYHNIFEILC